jgi:D-inositol-3-phosphate glycosyltransferase
LNPEPIAYEAIALPIELRWHLGALYQRVKMLGNTTHSGDNDFMRIAMISYHTCPLATLGGKDTGGMNVYVRDLTRELGRRGVGVDVFTRSQDEHVPHVLHDLGFGNRIVHIPAGPETPLSKETLAEYIPEFIQGIQKFAQSKQVEYDLIHSHYWLSGLAGLELRKIWQIPMIQMFHTLAVMKNRVARGEEDSESNLRLKAEQELMQKSDRIVAATQAELAQLQWLHRADTKLIRVIPPGVDTTRFYPIPKDEALEFIGTPARQCMLLYVGRVEPLKGIDTLFEAMAILKKEGFLDLSPLCLAIIGGDPQVSREEMSSEMERLQKLQESLGIDDLITFLGRRAQDTLQYYYSAAEIVVVPSHYESFGMVALEAMACGTPVIASETGGLAFLVKNGETGFHVPAADPQALAEKVKELMMDEVLRARLGKQAAQYAKEFSWSIIVDQILDLYASVLSSVVDEWA